MADFLAESSAPRREVKRMQFGLLSPDEIVSRLSLTLYLSLIVLILIVVIFLSEIQCQKHC